MAGSDHYSPVPWIDTKDGSIPIVKQIYQANISVAPQGPPVAVSKAKYLSHSNNVLIQR